MAESLQAILERSTKTASEGGEIGSGGVPRRKLTFTVDHRVTSGVFDEDFDLTLQALSVGQELSISSDFGADQGMALMHEMAKKTILQFDGDPIANAGQREFLWDALGSGGRQIVLQKMAELAGPLAEAVGKANDSAKAE